MVPKSLVTDILPRENGVTLVLKNGKTLDVDHVVVAVGIDANMDLARKAGLEVDERRGGIVVNSELESRRNVFAAGDASSYHDIALGRRRVEHYEHAIVSGKVAGENMTGARKPYKHQPMFWFVLSAVLHQLSPFPFLGGLYTDGLDCIGVILVPRLDTRLLELWTRRSLQLECGPRQQPRTPLKPPRQPATSARQRWATSRTRLRPMTRLLPLSQLFPKVCWSFLAVIEIRAWLIDLMFFFFFFPVPQDDDKYGKGIVYYLKNKKVVGVLTWNMFNKMNPAREIIRQGKEFSDYSELAKLIKIETKDEH